MEKTTTFMYTYSADANAEVREIRRRYLPLFKTYQNTNTINRICQNRKGITTMYKNDQEFLVQKIRTQYTEKEQTGLETLKELDAKVKRPANVFAYIFGSISAIIMGAGMSLVMTDIGATIGVTDPMIPGIVIGIIGMAMAAINYPIYKGILGARRKKYADKIIALSDQIMKD